MKRVLSVLLALVIIVAAVPLGAFEFKAEAASTTSIDVLEFGDYLINDLGSTSKYYDTLLADNSERGTSWNNAIIIDSAEELAYLCKAAGDETAGKYYKVADGIKGFDLSAGNLNYSAGLATNLYKIMSSGKNHSGATPGFQGNFDGNGATVYGAWTNHISSPTYAGLFSCAKGNVTIKNINVKLSYFVANGAAGGIIGYYDGNGYQTLTIENCSVSDTYIETKGSNYGNGVGAIVGYARNLYIRREANEGVDLNGDGDTNDNIYINGAINITNCYINLDEKYFISPAEGNDTSVRCIHGGVAGFVLTNKLMVSDCVVIGVTPYAKAVNGSQYADVQHSGLEHHFNDIYTDAPTGKISLGTVIFSERNFTGRVFQLSKSQMQGARARVNMPNLAWGVDWFVGSTGQYPTPIRPRYYTTTSSSGSTTVPTVDVKKQIGNMKLGPYALKGATIEILGYEISLIDIEANLTLNLTDNLKVIVDQDKTIKVLLGFDDEASANIQGANKSDTYWSDSYKEVKSMYQKLTGKNVDTTKLWNDFSKTRGKLKKFNASMVVDVSAEVAGFVEFKYTNSGYQFSEGGVMASFSASTSLRSYYGPCYVALGIEAGIEGSLTFVNENNKINPQVTVSPEFTLSAGAGIGGKKTYAQVDAYGTLEAIISTTSKEPFSAGLDIGARWKGYLFGKEIFSGKKSFASVELYPDFGSAWSARSVFRLTPNINVSNSDTYYDLINAAEPISRDYLMSAYSLRRISAYTNASFVKENLYPLNVPEMVKFDNDNILLLWVDDLGEKNINNIGTLMYSYFDGAMWSEPTAIFEDGTHNDMPIVYSDGKVAYIVWQKSNEIFDENIDTEETLKYYDLYTATFNSETKTFSNATCVNSESDTVFEFNPMIFGSDGSYEVLWIENTDNNVYQMSGTNALKVASFDSTNNLITTETVVETTNMIMETDISDSEIYYSVLEEGSNNLYCYNGVCSLIATNINSFEYESGKLFYSTADGFYSYDGTDTVQYENIASLDDFIVKSNGTDYALFTTVLNEDFSKTLYYSKLTSGANDWTDLEVYSQKGKYIRNYSPVMLSDGNIQVALNYYDEETERAALVVENCTTDVDVAVTYVDFDEAQIGNDTIDFEIGLKNNNSLVINSFTVEISDSTGVISTQTVEESLSAFEEKEISVNFALPENYASEKYSVKVMPNEYTELNEENNIAETTIECVHVVEWIITTEPTETTDGVETYRCTKCGESFEERVLPRLKFAGATLTIHNNISVNYKIEKSLFEETGYLEPYVAFEFNGKEYIKNTYTIVDDYYVFTFNNIAPNKINDTIKSTLYAVYGDKEYIVSGRDYSVAQYCYNMLDKCTDDKYAEFRTLLVDLLNYGAQSQIYTGYNTDNLANASLTDAQKAWGTSSTPTLETVQKLDFETIENPTVLWRGGGLVLEDSVTMRFIIETDNIDNLAVKMTAGDKTYTVRASGFKAMGENLYYVYFNNLNASQMSETVYLTVYNGEEVVSNTLRYSIESYAYAKVGGSDTALSDLLIAMMKYGNAAYNYVN